MTSNEINEIDSGKDQNWMLRSMLRRDLAIITLNTNDSDLMDLQCVAM